MHHESHEWYMNRCFELALQGSGMVSPNPMVGSVIVHNGEIVGEGYHERFGGPHAEVHAIASVGNAEVLQNSTLYVNLEPCSHFGKTPPCADLIFAKRIPRVVIGCRDPHEKVAGKGIERLTAAGVQVTEGVLMPEALKLNEAFIKSCTVGLPFVTLKLAQTLDGKIATAGGASRWITGEESRTQVHRLRCNCDAVVVGEATVQADDSELTVRHCAGRNPLRVLLDRRLSLFADARIFSTEAATLVFTTRASSCSVKAEQLRKRGVEVIGVDEDATGLDLKRILQELHRRGIISLLVEGGSRLSASFLGAALVDKLLVFIAPRLFGGDGLSAFAPLGVELPDQAVQLRFQPPVFFGRDLLLEAYVVS
ncbi:MAG: bifunctional diaminohydroxyphosphoribosylaminopyrimidine deaminase/5-amino-6-(5-phosphoribosylamino)uracil reductase RibD [Chlorobium sp.]|jgi:diaminohydroxyphosphoribosylaminopyrimidine deaminase/5-amino-6-(5-phosphoribosylamino)uracil reductase|nr:bifunctional diaminohydroxyphosphoribosylaminopyrimidine deaminase/5-amino-6-(5-phosphoribosylamino)uracil reductase RibD [Chlorobium sp.]